MKIEEGVDYRYTGWREGEVATAANRPAVVRLNEPVKDAPFTQWHEHVQAVATLRHDAVNAWLKALTDDQRAIFLDEAEQAMLREASQFYASRPAGSQRSFWD